MSKKTEPGFSVVIEADDRRLYRHDTPASAEAEARRLALANPGRRFYALHGFVAFEAIEPVRRIELDEIPF